MSNYKNLTGQRFGKLIAVEPTHKNGRFAWKCKCDCGNETIITTSHLTSGHTTSCGCSRKSTESDFIGQKFGKLTVLEKTNKKTSNNTYIWKCQCECGNIIEVNTANLKSGRTKSCGCLRKELSSINHTKDLTGQKFGRLTVLEKTNKRSNRAVIWKCQCDCGNIIEVIGSSLTRGTTRSCGCLSKEITAKRSTKDLAGQKFNKLTAIEPTKHRSNNCVIWKCKCDCGNITYASSSDLLHNKVKSCGCLISQGQMIITNLLTTNNISFISEYSFDTCRFPDTNYLAKFDFYVDNRYLIEFDGEQHFKYTGQGWNTEEHFKKTQEHDQFKNQWCKENNIPLIRIPYTHLKNLCIKDLLLEETDFICVEAKQLKKI